MRDPVRRILGNQYDKSSPMKEFDVIKANGIDKFISNPPAAFHVPPNWTGEEMNFTLNRDNDESFVYVVNIGDEFVSDYFLYYWKKRCPNQEALNKENLCARFARWTDTMRSSRTGHGGYNPIMRILQEIGINTAETI